jgi:glutaredoxin
MNSKVTIYTMGNCPYCTELKELYDKENIEYRNVDIDLPENKEEFNKIIEASKAEEVPIVRIDKQLFLPNVSFKSIVEAVDLTKKFLV